MSVSWSRTHDVYFPFYDDDVVSERRTVFHVPLHDDTWVVGDRLRLLSKPRFPRSKTGIVVNARRVHLLSDLEADLPKLCAADRTSYLERWDALHPEQPSAPNLIVWRVEFRYGGWEDSPDPPEWSLAA